MAGQTVKARSMGKDMMTFCGSSFWTASLSLSTSSKSFCLHKPPKSCWSVLWVESCWDCDEESTLGDEDAESTFGDGDDIERRRTVAIFTAAKNNSKQNREYPEKELLGWVECETRTEEGVCYSRILSVISERDYTKWQAIYQVLSHCTLLSVF